jgi:hypothetical protein
MRGVMGGSVLQTRQTFVANAPAPPTTWLRWPSAPYIQLPSRQPHCWPAPDYGQSATIAYPVHPREAKCGRHRVRMGGADVLISYVRIGEKASLFCLCLGGVFDSRVVEGVSDWCLVRVEPSGRHEFGVPVDNADVPVLGVDQSMVRVA